MPQGRRNRVLQGLRSRQLRILVATDVAARGIDVPTISHVVNYGLPMKAEDYVHRIGRTGRAGRDGLAVTLAERMDAGMIRRIQQFTTQPIPVGDDRRPRAEEPRSRRCSRTRRPVAAGPTTVRRAPPGDRATRRSPSAARRSASATRRASSSRARRRAAIRSIARLPVRDERGAAPARRPGPAAFKGRGKPQRPRAGGFSR